MKKYRSILLGILIVVGGVFVFSITEKKDVESENLSDTIEVKKIQTEKVMLSDIPYDIQVTGVLIAKNKIEVFSDTQGILKKTKTAFKIGNRFLKGDVLIKIDSQEFESQIKSNRSSLMNQIAGMLPDMEIEYPKAFKKWEIYLTELDVEQLTPNLPKFESNGEKLFVSGKNIYQTFFTIKNLEDRLLKYQIIAPFNGVVTESNINRGALVRNGQKLGEFINDDVFELELSIPATKSQFLKIGSEVVLSSIENTSQFSGKIKRINASVEKSTQTFIVIVEVKNKNVKQGQYLKATIFGKSIEDVMKIDNSLILENNQVFIVENKALKLQLIEVINYKDSEVIVKGLENGMLLVTEVIAGAYPGMIVDIK